MSYSGDTLTGHDAWKTTEPDRHPDDRDAAHKYECRDCNWRGRGGDAAFKHHKVSGHHRVHIEGLSVDSAFACCAADRELRRASKIIDRVAGAQVDGDRRMILNRTATIIDKVADDIEQEKGIPE